MNSEAVIQVPIPQHLQSSEACQAPLSPLPPPRTTHMTEYFTQVVEKEVSRFMPMSLMVHGYCLQLVARLRLNELELVAWAYVLKRVLYGEPLCFQTALLHYSAYLAKTLMCRDMSDINAEHAKHYPAFKESYEQWLSSHQRFGHITMRDMHIQFKDMWTYGRACSSTVNLNTVVDGIVQATTAKTENPLSQLPENTSTCQPDERQFSGSSVSTEAPRTHSGLFLDHLPTFNLRI